MKTVIDKLKSPLLGDEPYAVLIPDSIKNTDDKKNILIVHGMTDSVKAWMMGTGIEEYLENHGFAAVIPFAENSYYTDMVHGKPYFTAITEELPKIMAEMYGFSEKREKRAVIGNSMGGYGAFKIAMTCPRQFSAAVSFSGVLDLVHRFCVHDTWPEDGVKNWGEDYKSLLPDSENDLFRLVADVEKSGGVRPALRQICGREDYLYEENLTFRDFMLKRQGWDYDYIEGDGAHWWDFWDRMLPGVLDYIEDVFSKNE